VSLPPSGLGLSVVVNIVNIVGRREDV